MRTSQLMPTPFTGEVHSTNQQQISMNINIKDYLGSGNQIYVFAQFSLIWCKAKIMKHPMKNLTNNKKKLQNII